MVVQLGIVVVAVRVDMLLFGVIIIAASFVVVAAAVVCSVRVGFPCRAFSRLPHVKPKHTQNQTNGLETKRTPCNLPLLYSFEQFIHVTIRIVNRPGVVVSFVAVAVVVTVVVAVVVVSFADFLFCHQFGCPLFDDLIHRRLKAVILVVVVVVFVRVVEFVRAAVLFTEMVVIVVGVGLAGVCASKLVKALLILPGGMVVVVVVVLLVVDVVAILVVAVGDV